MGLLATALISNAETKSKAGDTARSLSDLAQLRGLEGVTLRNSLDIRFFRNYLGVFRWIV